jgi:hypothetical protein
MSTSSSLFNFDQKFENAAIFGTTSITFVAFLLTLLALLFCRDNSPKPKTNKFTLLVSLSLCLSVCLSLYSFTTVPVAASSMVDNGVGSPGAFSTSSSSSQRGLADEKSASTSAANAPSLSPPELADVSLRIIPGEEPEPEPEAPAAAAAAPGPGPVDGPVPVQGSYSFFDKWSTTQRIRAHIVLVLIQATQTIAYCIQFAYMIQSNTCDGTYSYYNGSSKSNGAYFSSKAELRTCTVFAALALFGAMAWWLVFGLWQSIQHDSWVSNTYLSYKYNRYGRTFQCVLLFVQDIMGIVAATVFWDSSTYTESVYESICVMGSGIKITALSIVVLVISICAFLCRLFYILRSRVEDGAAPLAAAGVPMKQVGHVAGAAPAADAIDVRRVQQLERQVASLETQVELLQAQLVQVIRNQNNAMMQQNVDVAQVAPGQYAAAAAASSVAASGGEL